MDIVNRHSCALLKWKDQAMNASPVPRLRIRHPESVEVQIEWHRDIITIGRDQQNDIVIAHPLASRRHATLERDTIGYIVRDLQSTNGTYVNGEVIADAYRLKSDDIVIIGASEIIFVDPEATQRGNLPLFTFKPVPVDSDITIDDDAKTVHIKGALLDPPLTVKEFQLLYLLYRRQLHVISKEEIAKAIWDYEVYDFNAIDALVYRVRQRIEIDPALPKYLVTVRGFGYKLVVAPEAQG
jgi:pSer/pThr/pTyr-binding forkhead associated (FHA) protein